MNSRSPNKSDQHNEILYCAILFSIHHAVPGVGHQLEVYQLPVGVWHQELEKALAAAQEEAEGSQTSVGTQLSPEV